ncbi:MAG TPA: ABC transporter permease [Myxococcota bacterium]|nr:ABC transporter permease [Myxococcota bacterium]
MAAPESAGRRLQREFLRRRRGVFGMRVILALFVLALAADFIANDKPYYLKLDGVRYYPIALDYGVSLGLCQWPDALLNQRFDALAERAEAALWPPIPYSPTVPNIMGDVFQPPSRSHWLGTDGLGRDVAAGMLHGIRVSLTIGLVVVAIQATIGIALGALAGYYGGIVDLALSRLIEVMIAIPTFFLILIVAATFPPSIYLVMAILGVTGWVGIARLIRSEFLRVRASDFVAAAQSLGASDLRVMLRHVLPNAVAPVLVAMSFGVSGAILTESGLSFLGIGVPAHIVTWGSILAVAQSNYQAWWLAVFPGVAIFVTMTAYNLLGDALRDALDPRDQGT